MTEHPSDITSELVGALTALLAAVDYTQGKKPSPTTMLGQAVDRPLIARGRLALRKAKGS